MPETKDSPTRWPLIVVFWLRPLLAQPRKTLPTQPRKFSLFRAQQDAWNRGDIDEFMNSHARSASTVFISDDQVRRGWDTVTVKNILTGHAQRVIASEKLYPARGENLFDNFERINMPSNDARHSFEQVSSRVTTFYVASNFRLATLSPDWSWKKTAQKKWPILCNLLVKHQRATHCIGRSEQILAGCN